MKSTLAITIFFFSFYNTFSQEWNYNIEVAQKIATEKNKNILVVFSGSDWCGPCIKMDQEIWQSAEFKDYSKDNLVLIKADFPRKKKNKLSKEQQTHNDNLAEKYNKQGYFPFVVVLNSKGKILGQTSYIKDFLPKDYINYFSDFE